MHSTHALTVRIPPALSSLSEVVDKTGRSEMFHLRVTWEKGLQSRVPDRQRSGGWGFSGRLSGSVRGHSVKSDELGVGAGQPRHPAAKRQAAGGLPAVFLRVFSGSGSAVRPASRHASCAEVRFVVPGVPSQGSPAVLASAFQMRPA